MMVDKQNLRRAALVSGVIEGLDNLALDQITLVATHVQQPFNPVSGTVYAGINALSLAAAGHEDPRWMTWKQAAAVGAQVASGEKATYVEIWDKEKNDYVYTAVFNASQIDGLEPYQPERWNRNEAKAQVAAMVQGTGVTLGPDDYGLNGDERMGVYPDALKALAQQSLVKLGHAPVPRGSEAEQKQDLAVTMACTLMEQRTGWKFGIQDSDHWEARCEEWTAILIKNPKELFRAAEAAERLAEWVLQPEKRRELEQSRKAGPEERAMAKSQPPLEEQIVSHLIKDHGWEIKREFPIKDLHAVFQGKPSQGSEFVVIERDYIGLYNFTKGADEGETLFDIDFRKLSLKLSPKEIALEFDLRVREKMVEFYDRNQDPDVKHRVSQEREAIRQDRAIQKAQMARTERRAEVHTRSSAPAYQAASGLSPEKEFIEFCQDAGLKVDTLVMDGHWHSVALVGDKGHEKSGGYRVHLDGHPNGWAKNHKTGETLRWIATGQTLSPQEREQLRRDAETIKAARQQEITEGYAKAAKKAYGLFANAHPVPEDHPYLLKKGVRPLGLKTTDEGTLLVPVRDVNGKLMSLQFINQEGEKRFLTGGQKHGGMLVMDPKAELEFRPVIIAEGYATAASICESLKEPVVVAFDAGNLMPVAEALRQRYPDKPLIIAADNDHSHKFNAGVEKAAAAARAVGGILVVPELNDLQKAQGLTDFNDLHRSVGRQAVQEAFAPALEEARTLKADLRRERRLEQGHLITF